MSSGLSWQNHPPEKLLAEQFHISTGFHPGQRDIIEQLVQGKRVLAIQRTGWGKSLEIYTRMLQILLRPHSLRCGYTHEEALKNLVAVVLSSSNPIR